MNRRLKRLGLALGISAVVITPTALVLSHWMNGGTTGTVHVGIAADAEAAPMSPVTVDTPLFTTTLPAGFTVRRQVNNPTATTALQLVAGGGSSLDQQVAITVATLPTTGLDDVGDYHLRKTDPTYAPATLANKPTGAIVFRTISGPPALTVFQVRGSQYVEVTMSTQGAAIYDQLAASYTQIVTNWNWKQ